MESPSKQDLGKSAKKISSKALAEWLYNFHLDHLSYFSVPPIILTSKSPGKRLFDISPRMTIRPSTQIYKHPHVSSDDNRKFSEISISPQSPRKYKSGTLSSRKDIYRIFNHKATGEDTLEQYRKAYTYSRLKHEKTDKTRIESAVAIYRPNGSEKKPSSKSQDPEKDKKGKSKVIRKMNKPISKNGDEDNSRKSSGKTKVTSAGEKKTITEAKLNEAKGSEVKANDVKANYAKTIEVKKLKREEGDVDLREIKQKPISSQSKTITETSSSSRKSKRPIAEVTAKQRKNTTLTTKRDNNEKVEMSLKIVDVSLGILEEMPKQSPNKNSSCFEVQDSPTSMIPEEQISNQKSNLERGVKESARKTDGYEIINANNLIDMLLPKYVKNSIRGENNGKEYYYNVVKNLPRTSSELTLQKYSKLKDDAHRDPQKLKNHKTKLKSHVIKSRYKAKKVSEKSSNGDPGLMGYPDHKTLHISGNEFLYSDLVEQLDSFNVFKEQALTIENSSSNRAKIKNPTKVESLLNSYKMKFRHLSKLV